MKRAVVNYLLLNIVLTFIVFCVLYFFQWNSYYKEFGLKSYIIIACSSMLVFFGVLIFSKLRTDGGFIIYLYCTLVKNGILIFYCYKYKEVIENLIVYILLIYGISMILEIVYILKLGKYRGGEK